MSLVLICSPQTMNNHPEEAILRELFNTHKDGTAETVNQFLSDNDVKYTVELGHNLNGEQLLAYKIEGLNLFALKF